MKANLAVALASAGEHEEAAALQSEVAASFRTTLGAGSHEGLMVLAQRADQHRNAGRHDEAILLMQECLDTITALGKERDELVQLMLLNTCVCHMQMGRWTLALEFAARRAIWLGRSPKYGQSSSQYVYSLTLAFKCNFKLANVEESRRILDHCRIIVSGLTPRIDHGPSEQRYIAVMLRSVGDCCDQLNDTEGSKYYNMLSLDQWRCLARRESQDGTGSTRNQAQYYDQMNSLAKAFLNAT